ncbi:23S rRNA G2445 N2-methylase RlmL [Paenibacillus sp. UNCCL117]|uniref:methyltransferase n=1 Tax=unclassified Paenibacillus TaxID=185978 RepID=UPI00088CF243|nr:MULTISPECIES: methyltransferase [unclassified Paenibacillus]SDD37659.1 23S rRNA G2445 N2-methylase RlmL [Paenibacillus sp. cl123]SFW48742.1 23S rRNA G2445 N2-methylase RlmL [Paenibacillus sp. UNCCL117]
MNYFATVLPGLEDLLIEEIKYRCFEIVVTKTNRGKVFFTTTLDIEHLKSLRLANNLYLVISELEIGLHRIHLHQLRDQVSRINLKPFLKKATSYYVNASRKGSHTYSRFEAANAAMEGIKKRYPSKRFSRSRLADAEFRLDIEDHYGLFSLKLTHASYRFRQIDRGFSAGSLLPTVAHAMVWLSAPVEEDIFIDPCCGSGTILWERLSYPFTYIGGGDINHQAFKAAKENLMDTFAEVTHWDARQLAIADASIDKVVTNLPFGRQISFGRETNEINRAILTEITRVMKTQGKAVILTENWDEILQVAASLHLRLLKSFPLSLKGLHPTIYVFEKVKHKSGFLQMDTSLQQMPNFSKY